MKNTQPWFQFLSRACPDPRGRVEVRRSESSQGSLYLDLVSEALEERRQVRFSVCLVDSDGLSRSIHSGEVSPAIALLEERLREARTRDPALPLLVAAAPDSIWPRSHAWMLGEYLAERDLPFWVDLRSLPEERTLAWLGRLHDTGLACPRTLIEIGSPGDLPAPSLLSGSRVWIASKKAENKGVELIQI